LSARTNVGLRAKPPSQAAARPGPAAPPRRPGLALAVIATAQLMVVLDATIVNVALPHIQRALGFSGTGLEWVVNAYALTFGGLLLLGGRAGDLLGRRKVFIAGIVLFSLASLVGGFASTEAWLLAARAVQGAGAAIIAPTALSLVTATFPEGPPRNRAMSVYAAMSVAGGALGLIAGGLLTSYASWRWATSPNGVSHWGDTKVVASLAAAVVLLTAFVFTEMRSKHALLPPRIFGSRDRSGAFLIMLCVGTSLFGMFFFLTIFVQSVWGYSALKTGVAYLPMMAAIMATSGASAQLIPRIGARPLLITGSATAAGGMFWLSRIGEHSHYATGLLGPTLVAGAGLGLLFMPLTLVALSRVHDADAGVASSLLNAGQQVGGSIGLAVLGTVAWTAVANSVRSQLTAAAATAARAGHPVHAAPGQKVPAAIYQHALATGFSRGFEVSAGIALPGLVVTIAAIRVRRSDLDGTQAPISA
jgi:MFS family permease